MALAALMPTPWPPNRPATTRRFWLVICEAFPHSDRLVRGSDIRLRRGAGRIQPPPLHRYRGESQGTEEFRGVPPALHGGDEGPPESHAGAVHQARFNHG